MSLTIGSREEDGRKELLLIICGEDIENFREGQEIVKSSGDAIGDFTVTVVLARPYAVHPQCRRLLNQKGRIQYRGFTLITHGVGYKTVKGDDTDTEYTADTLNELLHQLDKHDSLEEAKESLLDTGEFEFKGRTIRPADDDEYTVTGHDRYECALDALHAIDRGDV